MTQLRRTKPIFLVLAGVFLLIAVVFLMILVINLRNGAMDRVNGEVNAENNQYILFEPTESLTNEDIIRMYGFHIGEMGKVFDSDGIQYVQYDNSIRVLHEGALYIISVVEIRESQKEDISLLDRVLASSSDDTISPTQPAVVATQKPTQQPTTEAVSSRSQDDSSKSEQQEPVQQAHERAPVYEDTSGLEYSQPDNVVHPQNGGTAEDSIKLNPAAISVNKGDSFYLSLIGAGDGVQWNTSSEVVEIKEISGNSCLLKAHKTAGTTVITASYNNKTYICKVTIN